MQCDCRVNDMYSTFYTAPTNAMQQQLKVLEESESGEISDQE